MILREDTHLESPWTPKGYTAFKILLSARLCAAVWNIVGDCDETYNYWEPVSSNYLTSNATKMKAASLVVFLYMFYKNIIHLPVVATSPQRNL